jgi:hypothetical protein
MTPAVTSAALPATHTPAAAVRPVASAATWWPMPPLLLPIARAHHVPLDELVGAPTSGDPRIYPRPIQRNGTTWLPLTRNPGGPAVFKQIIPAGP